MRDGWTVSRKFDSGRHMRMKGFLNGYEQAFHGENEEKGERGSPYLNPL